MGEAFEPWSRVAEALLHEDHDSSSLRALLTEPALTEADWTPLFKQTMSDLGVSVPSRKEAAQIIAEELGRMIVNKEVPPRIGARTIWELLGNIDEITPGITIFCELDCALDGTGGPKPFSDLSRSLIEQRVIDEARKLFSK